MRVQRCNDSIAELGKPLAISRFQQTECSGLTGQEIADRTVPPAMGRKAHSARNVRDDQPHCSVPIWHPSWSGRDLRGGR